jgi:hypothetical protein
MTRGWRGDNPDLSPATCIGLVFTSQPRFSLCWSLRYVRAQLLMLTIAQTVLSASLCSFEDPRAMSALQIYSLSVGHFALTYLRSQPCFEH